MLAGASAILRAPNLISAPPRSDAFGALRFMEDRALDATPEHRRLTDDRIGWETAARPWEEIWIEEPQGQGRLHPDPSSIGGTNTGVKGGEIVTLWRLRCNDQCCRVVFGSS